MSSQGGSQLPAPSRGFKSISAMVSNYRFCWGTHAQLVLQFSAKDPLSNSWEMVTSPKDPLNSAYLSERPIHAVGCTSQYLGHVRGDDAARFSAQTRRRRVFPHHRRGAERVQAQPPLTCRGGVLVGSLRTHRGGRARPRPCGTPPRVRGAQHSAPQRKRRVRAAAHGGCERVPSSVRTSG